MLRNTLAAFAMLACMLLSLMVAAHAADLPSCPNDNVVWANTKSHVYHYRGTVWFGTTKNGAYECESAALTKGDRAAKNETRPTPPDKS